MIALVITIIVLLILAGVSITMISGDDGIAARAVESKNKTEVADDEEKIDLALSEYKLVKIEENAPALEDFLETKDWCESATLDDVYDIDLELLEEYVIKQNSDGEMYAIILTNNNY